MKLVLFQFFHYLYTCNRFFLCKQDEIAYVLPFSRETIRSNILFKEPYQRKRRCYKTGSNLWYIQNNSHG